MKNCEKKNCAFHKIIVKTIFAFQEKIVETNWGFCEVTVIKNSEFSKLVKEKKNREFRQMIIKYHGISSNSHKQTNKKT